MADPYAAIAHDPYAAIAKPRSGQIEDVARSIGSGLMNGVAGLADMGNPGNAVMKGAEFGAGLVSPKAAAFLKKYAPPSFSDQAQPLGGSYQPQSTPGRYAKSIATMAPNALLGPEGVAPRIASAVLPGVGAQGAADLTKAVGGGPVAQGVARFAGGVAGAGPVGLIGARSAAAQLGPKLLTPAEQPVAQSVRAALALDGTTPAAAIQAVSGGKLPATASPGLGQLAETVAQQPGVGAVHLQDAVGARMAGARDRALQAVTTHLGVDPQAAQGDVNAIVQQGRAAVGPAYDALRANPAPVWNQRLALLAQTPAVKKAIGVVTSSMQNDPDGPSPTAAGFQIDPDTGAWVLPKSGSLEGLTENQPTAATWIGVHQALGQTVERNPLTGAVIPDSLSPGNYNIAKVGGYLKSALAGDPQTGEGGAIPGYNDVLNQAGDYLSVKNAFDRLSGKALTQVPVAKFQQAWDSLKNPAEQQAGQASIANDALTKSEGNQFLPGAFKSPGVQQKLSIAFGPDAASNFTGQMESDLAERGTYNRILQGSPTARRTNLENAYQAANAPSGIGGKLVGLIQNGTGMADTIASFTHPVTAVTRAMSMASKALGGDNAAPPPWQDPAANAQLGQVLSDPGAFSTFLAKMQAQDALDAQSQAAQQNGALQGFAGVAPGLLSGVVAPQAALVAQGQQPQ